jgi:hypothetical protein
MSALTHQTTDRLFNLAKSDFCTYKAELSTLFAVLI